MSNKTHLEHDTIINLVEVTAVNTDDKQCYREISTEPAQFETAELWADYRPNLADQEIFDFYNHDTFWALDWNGILEYLTIVLIIIGIGYELFFKN